MDIGHFYEDNPMRSFGEISEKYRSLFNLYPSFNVVQSKVFNDIFKSNRSVVVAAPTGSGKTVILELAVVKVLVDLEGTQGKNDFKIIYISPVKALCRERFSDWNPRFSEVGLSCIEVTGDGDDYFDLRGYNVIITTPEKWDSLTRKWRDNASLVQLIKLFMIDEVHLLSDHKRGPVLEAIVCRMKTVSKTFKLNCIRFVAISATVFNVEDLATWLGNEAGPAFYHKFGNDVRPVNLQKVVRGYQCSPSQSAFLFDLQLSYKLKSIIVEYAKGKPTLVFCSTRKSVIQTAKILTEQLTFYFTDIQKERLQECARLITDCKLRDLVLCGVGYHHAGVSVGDRHAIQNLFVAGSLPILVATSTLAMGVNLPAHLVIIKSTQQFVSGLVEEYSESSILQMIGRAGRPQFDTTATAVIMTKSTMVEKYENLLDSKEILESSLHHHLPEHLNSEIVLHTITDLSVAMEWIRSTFLYVRALKNPRYYGFGADANQYKVEKCLENICLKEINGLQKAELITFSADGLDISPTPFGRLMSHYYVSFETFKIFLSMKGSESMGEILTGLSEAQEFSEVQLRVNERKILNDLNKSRNRDTIRYPLAGKIKTRSMKVNCLIQACLGCLSIPDPALLNESIRIVKLAARLCRCLSDILAKRQHYDGTLNAVILSKCLHARLWEDSPFVCRQLDRIGQTSSCLLVSCGKTSFNAIENSNPRELERIVNRAPPFGNVLQEAVHHLPKYCLKLENERLNTLSFRTVITLSLLNADVIRQRNTTGSHHSVSLIIGDTEKNLRNLTRINDQSLMDKDFQISVVSRYPNLPFKIIVNVVSNTWVGVDISSEIIIVSITETPASTMPAKRKRKADIQCTREEDSVKKYIEEKPYSLPMATMEDQSLECCFDIDIVILEDDKVEPLKLPPWKRVLSESHTLFSRLNSEVNTNDNSSEMVFESVEDIVDHIKTISPQNIPCDLDSGYHSGFEAFAQKKKFFKNN